MKCLTYLKCLFAILINILTIGNALCQSGSVIEWGQKVNIQQDSPGNLSDGYGSQYGRLLQLKNGKWIAGYTIKGNDCFEKNKALILGLEKVKASKTGLEKDKTEKLSLEFSISNDQCLSWKKISVLEDPCRDLDNAQLIELPDGSILLACRSVIWQQSYFLPVFKSIDTGKTWKRISIIDENIGLVGSLGKPDKGVYEPHFNFLNDGRLSVMYANEKHVTNSPSYSQIISQKVSADFGKSWGKELWVALEPGHNASRPGMPVLSKMRNGEYIVVYEICGPEQCNVYAKFSKDGINWPIGLGTKIPDQNAAPYVLSLTDGTLVLTSNINTISVSNDYGKSWHLVNKAWEKTLWPSLYQTGENEIAAVNSVKNSDKGNRVSLRLGKINKQVEPDTESIFLGDPTIFFENGLYYLYGTVEKNADNGFMVYVSKDKKTWTNKGFALKKGETFGTKGFWAPQLFKQNDTYYMAYTADEHIAIASSNNLLGPFTQEIKAPLDARNKQIDPFVFIDSDGKIYLYHVRLGGGNKIFVAELNADFSGIKPETLKLCIDASDNWENTEHAQGPVTEGPSIIKHKGLYYLFYSANDFRNKDYAVGYATSNTPYGPWKKFSGNPILSRTFISQNGTGHGDFFADTSGLYYVFHTHNSTTAVSKRRTAIIKVNFIKPSPKLNEHPKNQLIDPDEITVSPESFYYLKSKN